MSFIRKNKRIELDQCEMFWKCEIKFHLNTTAGLSLSLSLSPQQLGVLRYYIPSLASEISSKGFQKASHGKSDLECSIFASFQQN
jgi:hypothetical protein